MTESKMYVDPTTEEKMTTINHFIGCYHYCIYCERSFQRQMKRQKQNCEKCYNFAPHMHWKRLKKAPPRLKTNGTFFLEAYGDLSFAIQEEVQAIIDWIQKYPEPTFMIQSKNPAFFNNYEWPENVYLGTTIESNWTYYPFTPSKYRFYEMISKAIIPFDRKQIMKDLTHPLKYVTIEPILYFGCDLIDWIEEIDPKFVYIGYDNHNCKLPEPELKDTQFLIEELQAFTEVRLKTIRKAWFEELRE